MGKLTDIQIKAWIKAGERFEGNPMAMDCISATGRTTQPPYGAFAISS